MAKEEMSKADVQITYEGAALADGVMDVRELAPALLAFGDLVRDANSILNGERAIVRVLVCADFRKGSFAVDFEIIQKLLDRAMGLLTGDEIDKANAILRFLGIGSAYGLFQLVRKIGSRRVKNVVPVESTTPSGTVRLEIEGMTELIEVAEEVAQLAKDQRMRENLAGVTRPLTREGVESLRIHCEDDTPTVITSEEADSYLPPTLTIEDDDAATETSYRTRLAVHTVTLGGDMTAKWRFHDGENLIWVRIEDPEFCERVRTGEPFSKGDILDVTLRVQQTEDKDGRLSSSRAVTKVHDHIRAPRQQGLPLDPHSE